MVEIDDDQNSVRVIVRDDGRGFDTAAQTSWFGLLGMRERAEVLSGTIEVESSPEQGTTVTATLPTLRRHTRTA